MGRNSVSSWSGEAVQSRRSNEIALPSCFPKATKVRQGPGCGLARAMSMHSTRSLRRVALGSATPLQTIRGVRANARSPIPTATFYVLAPTYGTGNLWAIGSTDPDAGGCRCRVAAGAPWTEKVCGLKPLHADAVATCGLTNGEADEGFIDL